MSKVNPFENPLTRTIASLVVGSIGLPTIPILIAIMSTSKYRSYSYSLYFTIMSFYDFVFVFDEMSQSVLLLFHHNNLIVNFIKLDFLCKLRGHMTFACLVMTKWFNVAVAIDRFIVIAFPFKKDIWCTRRNSWIVSISLIIIVHAIGFAHIHVHVLSYYPFGNIGYYCSYLPIFIYFYIYLNYILGGVVSIVIICIFTAISVYKLYIVKISGLKYTKATVKASSSHVKQTATSAYFPLERKKRTEMTSSQALPNKDKTSRATVALLTIGVSAVAIQFPFIANEFLRMYAYFNRGALYEWMWFGGTQFYIHLSMVFESLSLIMNVQNFYILFLLNGTFRRDVYNMFTCKNSSKKDMPAKK